MNKLLVTLMAGLFAVGAFAQAAAPAVPAVPGKAATQKPMNADKQGAGPKSSTMMPEKANPPGPKKAAMNENVTGKNAKAAEKSPPKPDKKIGSLK